MPWRQREWDHNHDLLRQLMRISLFRGMLEEDLELLSKELKIHKPRNGQRIVTQDEEGSSMFIIGEGLYKVTLANENESDKELATLEPGDFFGEKSLLTGEKWSASVVCIEDGIVAEVTKEAMAKLFETNPDVTGVINQAMAIRERENKAHLEENMSEEESIIDDEAFEILKKLKAFFLLS